jgi:FkbM family methyltransferase
MFASVLGATLDLFTSVRRVRNAGLPSRLRAAIMFSTLRVRLASIKRLPNPMPIAGFRIWYFRPGQLRYLFEEIFINGVYRFQADNERPTIFDCGSNIGMSILFFKTLYCSARIVGFEPDPVTFARLKENIEKNALSDVVVHQCALSDEEGQTDFFTSDDEEGSLVMSTLNERISGRKISVPSRRLSSFITGPIDLLKMDIEGAEEQVLRELAASEKLRMIKQMHIEYHHHISPGIDTLSSTLRLLEDEGFGYELAAQPRFGRLPQPRTFQDIAIFAYRKDLHGTTD